MLASCFPSIVIQNALSLLWNISTFFRWLMPLLKTLAAFFAWYITRNIMKVKSPHSNSETSCWSHFSQYKESEGLVLLSDGSEVLVNLCLVQSLELGVVLGDNSHLDNMGVTRRRQYKWRWISPRSHWAWSLQIGWWTSSWSQPVDINVKVTIHGSVYLCSTWIVSSWL